jgi:RNA polymerase sigma-70 factor (ECF subfamily)
VGRTVQTTPAVQQLEHLYRRHHRRVRWVLRGCGVGDHDLDDAVHDVFLALHRRLAHRDPRVAEEPWLIGVARNVAFSRRRSTARRRRMLETVPEPASSPSPDEGLARRRAWQRLHAFLEALPDEQREVFVLMDVLGMATAETAQLTGAPANTVSSRLRLARRRFGRVFVEADGSLRAAVAGEQPSPEQRKRTWAAIVAGLPVGKAAVVAGAITMSTIGKWAAGIAAVALVGISLEGARVGPGRSVPELATRPEPPRASPAITDPARLEPAAPPHAPPAEGTRTASALEPAAGHRPADARPRPRRSAPKVASPTATAADPSASSDGLDHTLTMLRRAQAHLGAHDPIAALAVLDTLPPDDGPLHRDRVRTERRAACAAGRADRAQVARDELVRLELVTPGEAACP